MPLPFCHNVVAFKLWHCGDACCLGVVVAADVLVVVEMLLLGVAVASVAIAIAIAVAPTNTISILPVDCHNFLCFHCCSFVVFAVDVTIAVVAVSKFLSLPFCCCNPTCVFVCGSSLVQQQMGFPVNHMYICTCRTLVLQKWARILTSNDPTTALRNPTLK